MKPTLGRVVLFTLSKADAEAINKRRSDFAQHVGRASYEDTGYIAHFGNEARQGDAYPATVVRVWNEGLVNLSVQLDGTDTYWATSVHEGTGAHEWAWPPRV